MTDLCDTMLNEMRNMRRDAAEREHYRYAASQLELMGILFDEFEDDPRDLLEELNAMANAQAAEDQMLN